MSLKCGVCLRPLGYRSFLQGEAELDKGARTADVRQCNTCLRPVCLSRCRDKLLTCSNCDDKICSLCANKTIPGNKGDDWTWGTIVCNECLANVCEIKSLEMWMGKLSVSGKPCCICDRPRDEKGGASWSCIRTDAVWVCLRGPGRDGDANS